MLIQLKNELAMFLYKRPGGKSAKLGKLKIGNSNMICQVNPKKVLKRLNENEHSRRQIFRANKLK
jgi:hypothetical protein